MKNWGEHPRKWYLFKFFFICQSNFYIRFIFLSLSSLRSDMITRERQKNMPLRKVFLFTKKTIYKIRMVNSLVLCKSAHVFSRNSSVNEFVCASQITQLDSEGNLVYKQIELIRLEKMYFNFTTFTLWFREISEEEKGSQVWCPHQNLSVLNYPTTTQHVLRRGLEYEVAR